MKSTMKFFHIFITIAYYFIASFTVNAANIASTSSGGNWNSPATWNGNAVPTVNDNVTINGNVAVTANAICKKVTINSGKILSFAPGGYSLTISSNQWATVFENNGTFSAGDGRVVFTSTATGFTVSGTVVFNHVVLNNVSQMNFGSGSTINGTIRLNNNSKIIGHPNYGTNAILEVNQTISISTNYYLWGSTGSQVPPNIVIVGGTVTAQQTVNILKTLTVNNGATLDLARSCTRLKSGFQSFNIQGSANLGGMVVESGVTWNLNSNMTLSNLTIQNNAVVNAGSYILQLIYNTTGTCGSTGRIIKLEGNGQFNAGTSTLVVNTSSNGNASFEGDVTINNLVAAGGTIATNVTNANFEVTGTLTLNSGANFQYGNPIDSGTLTFTPQAVIVNNGGTLTNVTTTVPSAPAPVEVVSSPEIEPIKTDSISDTITTGLTLIAPVMEATLTGDLVLAGTRKVIFIYPSTELKSNGNSVDADTLYLYGNLNISNPGGLNDFLGNTKLVINAGSNILFTDTTGIQTIAPRSDYQTLSFVGGNVKALTGNTVANKVYIGPNQSLNLNGSKLTINSNIVCDGWLQGDSQSELEFNSSDSTHLKFSQANGANKLRKMTVQGGAKIILDTTLIITEELSPVNGTVTTGGHLVMKSDANGTARISNGGCTTCNYISGDVTVERFVPAIPTPGPTNSFGRRWRFLASPTTNATLSDWQAQTFITGPGAGTNGFDGTHSSSSVFFYDETNTANNLNTGWVAPSNINHTLTPGKGFRLFVRGDRSNPAFLQGTTTPANAVTVSVTAPVNMGDITMLVTGTNSGAGNTFDASNDGWNFLGNPYPSDYDWNAFWDANNGAGQNLQNIIEPTIWIYDATTASYKTYNALSNQGTIQGGIIPSGAAFFVKKIGTGNANITFKESFKTNTQAMNLFKTRQNSSFSISLHLDSTNSDELLIKYMSGASANKDANDVVKMNGSVNIAAYGQDNMMLAASVRPLTTTNDTIRLNVTGMNGTYTLRFKNSDLIAIHDNVQLIDQYTSQVIDLKTANTYTFSIQSTTAGTFGMNRFYILVSTPSSVPVNLLTFNAIGKDDQTASLLWATGSEVNSEAFVIERSSNGNEFEAIGSVKAQGNSQTAIQYAFIDQSPSSKNYYRLKMVDQDGSFEYSDVRMVSMNNSGVESNTTISVYPVPASDYVTVASATGTAIQQLHVYNLIGVLVYSIENSESESIKIDLSAFDNGVYVAETILQDGQSYRNKIQVSK